MFSLRQTASAQAKQDHEAGQTQLSELKLKWAKQIAHLLKDMGYEGQVDTSCYPVIVDGLTIVLGQNHLLLMVVAENGETETIKFLSLGHLGRILDTHTPA